jgi:type IV pilus assembly protein PilW
MMTRCCKISETKGFSLVELMVAMVIALVLLGGIYQVFFASNTTYRQTSGLSRLQENGRVALELIAQAVRQAGYPRFSDDGIAFADAVVGSTSVAITGADGDTDGNETTSDWVRVSSHNGTGRTDVTFSHDAAQRELVRRTEVIDAGTGVVTVVENNQPFIDGVESLQILYGIDLGQNGTVNFYRDAEQVTVAAAAAAAARIAGTFDSNVNYDWDYVVAVRVGLLLRTPDEPATGDIDTNRYDVDGLIADWNGDGAIGIEDMRPARTDAHYNTVNGFDPPDDRNLRQVFRTTIALRNRVR